MADDKYTDHTNNTYGAEWAQISADAMYGPGSASDGWSKLAAYYAKHQMPEAAQWCGMMAGGMSYDQADAVFKQKEQSAAGMKPIIDVPAFGL